MCKHEPAGSESGRQTALIMYFLSQVETGVSWKSVFAGSNLLMDYLPFKSAILIHNLTVSLETLLNI